MLIVWLPPPTHALLEETPEYVACMVCVPGVRLASWMVADPFCSTTLGRICPSTVKVMDPVAPGGDVIVAVTFTWVP